MGPCVRDEAVAEGPADRPPREHVSDPTRRAGGDRGRARGAGRTAWRRGGDGQREGRGATTIRSATGAFTEWAQGKGGEIYPENVGKLVMPGTKVEFQMHYHAVGEEITDAIEMGWWFYPKGQTPKYSAEYMTIGAVRELQIPPNTVTQHQGTSCSRRRRSCTTSSRTCTIGARRSCSRRSIPRPPGGHQPGRPLHQHLAHQLHLRSGLRAGVPQGNRPQSRRFTTTRPRTRTIRIRGSG